MKHDNDCCNLAKQGTDNDCCIEDVGEMIRRLVRVFQMFERDQIKVFGFTTSQCYVLLEVWKSKKLTMNELSARMNLDSSTMTRVISNLVRDGLVVRTKDDNDRRVVNVELADKGREAAEKLNGSIQDYYRSVLEHLPEGRVDEVLRSVSILLEAFDKANPNCC